MFCYVKHTETILRALIHFFFLFFMMYTTSLEGSWFWHFNDSLFPYLFFFLLEKEFRSYILEDSDDWRTSESDDFTKVKWKLNIW